MEFNINEISIEVIKAELEKYKFIGKDLELFDKGKEFIDKATELNDQTSNNVKQALFLYAIYKLRK